MTIFSHHINHLFAADPRGFDDEGDEGATQQFGRAMNG